MNHNLNDWWRSLPTHIYVSPPRRFLNIHTDIQSRHCVEAMMSIPRQNNYTWKIYQAKEFTNEIIMLDKIVKLSQSNTSPLLFGDVLEDGHFNAFSQMKQLPPANTSLGYCFYLVMMTSSNGSIFRVTGHLCGEFTGPGEFPTQRPVMRRFDVSLIRVWMNGWVNNRESGDLRRYRAHYDVSVMGGSL